jgi:putative ABC transport system permease protein
VEQPVWVTPEVLLRKVRRLQDTIALTVGSIAALCLVLGGTTLMSLMVANVRDRVTEIGLRTALGATPRDIAGLFVAEGALVAAAAGLVATAGTHLLLLAGNGRLPVPVAVDAATVALPALVAVGLGIVFSYWPARTAARIMPAEALRND